MIQYRRDLTCKIYILKKRMRSAESIYLSVCVCIYITYGKEVSIAKII